MKLMLKWKNKDKVFNLGILEKNENKYLFNINEEELQQAMQNGCTGIGMLREEAKQIDNKLFSFFANRIPKEDNINIKEILTKYNLEKYDDMELLKLTKARLITDKYYVSEID